MINLPYISLPEYFTRLLASNIQNNTQSNTNLELYINENKEFNALVKKLFRDIDPDGFLGKILSISGWTGIRNRMAAVYLEHAMTGKFPDTANINLVSELVNVENKLRHFTQPGFSRAFMLAFYAKMTHIHLRKLSESTDQAPLIIKDEHIELMRFSKAKSVRIDWLMLELIHYEHFFGLERVTDLLTQQTRHEALFALLTEEEKEQMIHNCLTYGASINDQEFFTSDTSSS